MQQKDTEEYAGNTWIEWVLVGVPGLSGVKKERKEYGTKACTMEQAMDYNPHSL